MINAVGYAAKHSFSRLKRFEFQRLAVYNGPVVPKAMAPDGRNMYGKDNTFGGYYDVIVVREDFVLRIPGGLRPEVAAPMLYAGVTTYSPMKHWGVKTGSVIGNIADTQEILDFCTQHQIGPDVEVIPIDRMNDACDQVEKGDVRLRYVIEMASLKPGLES